MKLPEPLIKGTFITRYKRFMADMYLEDGTKITAHCPNSGSMMGLLQEGNPVLLSRSSNKKRKFPYTWELVRVNNTWVGVNTSIPNNLVHEALQNQALKEFSGYTTIKREAFGAPHARLDFLVQNSQQECYMEVKNVTLVENGIALFPDAKTERGRKHIQVLIDLVHQGKRGVMFYLVNREDCHLFKPAAHIDPQYAEALRMAYQQGVEIVVYRVKINPPQIFLDTSLQFKLD